jgi:hypothetical protein
MATRYPKFVTRGVMVVIGLIAITVGVKVTGSYEPGPSVNLALQDRRPIDAMAWLTTVMQGSLNLDSENFAQQLQESERYFTRDGYRDYILLLQQMRAIDHLRSGKVSITTSVDNVPRIVSRRPLNGVYTWNIQVETTFVIAFQGNSLTYPVKLAARLVRVSDEQAFFGIRIAELKLLPTGSTKS